MVKSAPFLSLCLLVALGSSGVAEDFPAYRLGDTATNDVITTRRLLVVDAEATAALRAAEARKVAPFVVYSTNHAAFVEKQVRQAVARKREEFFNLLQSRYGTRRLVPEVLESQGFQEMVEQFLAVGSGPPVPRQALIRWAESAAGEEFLASWFAPLRQTLAVPVAPDRLPVGWRPRDNLKLSLIRVRDLGLFVKEDFAFSNQVPVFATNLVPLAAARRNLRAAFPDPSAPAAAYLAEQLQANCRFDTNLTERVKVFAGAGLVRMQQFEPGEVVIRKGERIDAQALASLTEMREAAKVTQLEQQLAVKQVAVQLHSERNVWLAGLLGAAALGLLSLWAWSHRRRRRELLPVLSSSVVHPATATAGLVEATVVEAPPGEEEEWRRRALEAERRIERVQRLARSSLMPHLAQQLKDSVVQQLASQMDDMLDVQAAVADQLAAMEERLERMQAPLQERLRAYEQRISELEQELTQRGQENQVLLRARIEALRWQMDQERAKANVGAN